MHYAFVRDMYRLVFTSRTSRGPRAIVKLYDKVKGDWDDRL